MNRTDYGPKDIPWDRPVIEPPKGIPARSSSSASFSSTREARRVIALRQEELHQDSVLRDEYVQRTRLEPTLDQQRQLDRGPSLGL